VNARIAVLQHEPETALGAFAPLLDAADVEYEVVRTDDAVLPGATFDGVLALGGSLRADERRLLETRRWIRDRVLRGLPFLGVCLGGQLLARALGAAVARAATPELGIHDILLTEAARRDPLFYGLPRRIQVFGWHEDTFSLPPGAIALARSTASLYQAFRFGPAAYGLQFHPEVRADDLVRWRSVAGYRRLAEGADVDWALVSRALMEATPTLDALSRNLLDAWLRLVADVALRRRPHRIAAA
jgi:GMP synthase (glutamine-hydrolysing)